MIDGVGQIGIPVRDLARAIAFYRDVVGLQLLFEAPPHMAFFECGGTRLMLSVPEKPEFDHPSSILYFRTDGIDREHERLAAGGAVFAEGPRMVARMPDHELWMAFFRDSENNTMALLEERRGAVG